MNKDLPFVRAGPGDIAVVDIARARTCAAWTTHFTDVYAMQWKVVCIEALVLIVPRTFSLGLMRPSSPIEGLGIVPYLPDTLFSWDARPLNGSTARYRGNTLFRERCVLTRLTAEVNHFLFSDGEVGALQDYVQAAQSLSSRVINWYESLPLDLQYDKRLPGPIYELQ